MLYERKENHSIIFYLFIYLVYFFPHYKGSMREHFVENSRLLHLYVEKKKKKKARLITKTYTIITWMLNTEQSKNE